MTWTDERVEQVKKLWFDEAKSASQIARVLGDVSRNSVIGIIHRRGWSGKRGSHNPTARQLMPRRPSIPRPKLKPVVPEPLVIPDFTLESGDHVTVITLTNYTCRWPIGTPGTQAFHFCGNNSERDEVYCEAHIAIAFQPGSINRRRHEHDSSYGRRDKAPKRFGNTW